MSPPGPQRPKATLPEELVARFPDARPLGAGAMGGVFSASDQDLGRRVAVKVLHAPDDDDIAIRFLREAETLARIQHPNVLRVLDHGRTPAGPYMVMELLDGAPLDTPPPDLDLEQVARDLAAGLEAVHTADVIHRDVKPANVMWVRPGRAVLIDFGLVHDPGKTALTRTGTLVGTPAYMSPEILMGESLSPASDWYALGISLYELAEGRRPYGMEEIHRIFADEGLPPLEFFHLAPAAPLRQLIISLTAHDPARRPADHAAVVAVLEAPARPHEQTFQEPTRPIGSTTQARPGADTGPHPARSSRSSPGPASAPGSRTWPKAVGLILLCFVLGVLSWSQPQTPATAPDLSQVVDPEEPESPFPEDFPERLAQELEEAMMFARSPQGEVVPAEGNLGKPGFREFLEPDPRRWPEQLAQAEELRTFDDWIRAGGDPLQLPTTLADALRGVGERYRNQGLPDPFFPMLEGPTHGPGPPPQDFLGGRLANDLLEDYPVPDRLGPWFMTAIAAHREALAEQERLGDVAKRSFEAREAVDDFPSGLLRLPLEIRDFDLQSLAEAAYVLESSRQPIAQWTHRVHRRYRRLMHAVAQSIEKEPETAGLTLATFLYGLRNLDGAAYGSALMADPSRELGTAGESPYGHAWRGYLRFRACVVQFHMNLDRNPTLHRVIEDFEKVLRSPNLTSHLQTLALGKIIDAYRDLVDGPQAHRVAERWLGTIDELPRAHQDEIFDKILEVWGDTELPPPPAVMARIEAHVASEGTRTRARKRLARIRAR